MRAPVHAAVYRALAMASVGSVFAAAGEGGAVSAAKGVMSSLISAGAIGKWNDVRVWTAPRSPAPWDGPCLSVDVSAFPGHSWTFRWPVSWLVPELADVVEVMES